MQILQSDFRFALQIAANTLSHLNNTNKQQIILPLISTSSTSRSLRFSKLRFLCFSNSSSSSSIAGEDEVVVTKTNKTSDKPLICTADELHYVPVPNTDWRLALWRYIPPLQAPRRNHPLLLLSGVGTNAIGYDLSPECSFARHMSNEGFDTWVLEVRGAGLSTRGEEADKIADSVKSGSIPEPGKSTDNGAATGLLSVENQSTSNYTSSDDDDEAVKSGSIPEPGKSTDNGAATGLLSVENQSTTNYTSSYDDDEADTSVVKREIKEVGNSDTSIVKGDRTDVVTVWDESQLVAKLTDTFLRLSQRLSGFLNEGQARIMVAKLLDQMSKLLEDAQLLERFNEIGEKLSGLIEARQNSIIANQVSDLSQRLVNLIEDSQRSVSAVSPQLFDLQERFATTLDVFQKQLDLIVHYDWDFDNYLEEDVPAAMEYIRTQTKPKDGKMIAIGHSMGGILLYAMLSKYSLGGRNSGLAAIVTLASSLDYTSSKSSLKLLLPLADPAQALNVPVVPLGALLAAAYPLTSLPPYALAWLNTQISAENMMKPELLKKLILNNFCTIPAKLLLQLTTAFREGGLRDRSGTFRYKDHLHKADVPVLALAGDEDQICPPEAVYETVKIFPEHLVSYQLLGEPNGPHYAHYDLVGGRMAVKQVYPCIVEFISRHDQT
ncbi:alpha/beta hydrolase family protein [Thalictrum thalictroides]|uniref:Alpha/beta hydrolase family protein n=1 Tax=Thalictrum thalictroides TaxID=46969 RepID=A0A7J6VWP1_THATH|nr:alpha/beta hydrolase family protein [Thalictrum thalictroides]